MYNQEEDQFNNNLVFFNILILINSPNLNKMIKNRWTKLFIGIISQYILRIKSVDIWNQVRIRILIRMPSIIILSFRPIRSILIVGRVQGSSINQGIHLVGQVIILLFLRKHQPRRLHRLPFLWTFLRHKRKLIGKEYLKKIMNIKRSITRM